MTIEVLERSMLSDVLPLDTLNLLVITDAHRMATCSTVHKVNTPHTSNYMGIRMIIIIYTLFCLFV